MKRAMGIEPTSEVWEAFMEQDVRSEGLSPFHSEAGFAMPGKQLGNKS
jgi:hypothetical protein